MKHLQAVAEEQDKNTVTSKRVMASAEIALKLATETSQVSRSRGAGLRALQLHASPPRHDAQHSKELSGFAPTAASLQTTRHDWGKAHVIWRTSTYEREEGKPKIIPNEQQRQVLELLHETCVREEAQLQLGPVPIWESPLRHLVHGLPGSGKSELLRWIRSYFEDVWKWTYGEEFAFLAPLNSMASNIGGSTIHSWGQVGFKDRRGVHIAPKSAEHEETPTLTIRCGKLRFLFIDEIEATGADTIGALEEHIRQHVGKDRLYKYAWVREADGRERKAFLPRAFGGVNVMFFGDFWQLNPICQIAIMSNPYGEKVSIFSKSTFSK